MNDLIKKLETSILNGRALHAYLISGTDGFLTDSVARTAAALILYSHNDTKRLENDPDYLEYEGSISIGEFRDELLPEIYRETYGKKGRVVVMRSASLLSQAVQNAMLKVLEEPPQNTYFILTGNEYGILPTIRSRCMILRCASRSEDEIVSALTEKGASYSEAKLYAAQSGYVTERAIRLLEDQSFRELRESVLSAFFSALSGRPNYKFTKTKYDKADLIESNEMLLLYCHDLIKVKCFESPDHCADRADELKKLSLSFTIGQIGCIINKLIENAQRLLTNASGAASFDRLFSELAELALGRPADSAHRNNR